MRRWVPKGWPASPCYVFETGGTTGIPKSRLAMEDFRIDYEMFSETLPDEYFPPRRQLADAGSIGPAAAEACRRASVPASRRHLLLRRSRSALGDQADQARAIWRAGNVQGARDRPGDDDSGRRARNSLHVHHAEAAGSRWPEELEKRGTSVSETGITGIFAGGTEFTPQYTRFAIEELLGEGVYMTPTYGNTLMGLACSKPVTAEDGYKITYYAPQPRAVIEVVAFDDYRQGRGLRRNRAACG